VIVLLPPSEGKAPGGTGTFAPGDGALGPAFGERRAEVAAALARELRRRSATTDKRILGATGSLADRAAAAAADIAAGRAAVLPAWQRYTGVVWEHLDPATLTPARRRRVLVPSALLGLVRGDDPVPDHRLKFSVDLGRLGRLGRWWRPVLTEAVTAHGTGPVVDLLPGEHAAAIDFDAVAEGRRLVRVAFTTAAGGGRAAGHAAKAVKGVLARSLLVGGVGALDGFEWEGWRSRRREGGDWEIVAPG
jgi:uncharacterized protein